MMMAVSERIRATEYRPHTGDNYIIRIRYRDEEGRSYWYDWRKCYDLDEVRDELEDLDHEACEYRVIYANVPPVEWKVIRV